MVSVVPEIDARSAFIYVRLLEVSHTAATVEGADERRVLLGRPRLHGELERRQRQRVHRVAEAQVPVDRNLAIKIHSYSFKFHFIQNDIILKKKKKY